MDIGNTTGWKWDASHNERCKALLSAPFWSDFTLVLGKERSRIEVNKIFLQSASRVLNEAIKKSDSGEIMIEDVETRIFKLLLQYMYTGDSGATLKDAFELLRIATEYEVWELKDQCASILSKPITENSVLTLLQGALEFAHIDLINASLDYICKNAMDILRQNDFSSLRLECLIQIIQQDRLAVRTEMDVFNAVFRWGEAECIRQNLDPSDNKDMKNVLSKALKFIRFPLMDATEFALNVASKSLLQMEDSMALLTCYLIPPEKRSEFCSDVRFSSTPRLYKSIEGLGDIILRRSQGAFIGQGWSTNSEIIAVMANESCRVKKIIFPKQIFGDYGYDFQYLAFDAVRVQIRTWVIRKDTCYIPPMFQNYPVQLNPNDENELVLDLETLPIELEKSSWKNIEVTFIGFIYDFHRSIRIEDRKLLFGSNYKTEVIGEDVSSLSFRFLAFKRPAGHQQEIPISHGLMNAFVVETV